MYRAVNIQKSIDIATLIAGETADFEIALRMAAKTAEIESGLTQRTWRTRASEHLTSW
jgi:hypothetical protein